MASFDIVSEVDLQALDNAINNLKKEILNRFDFQGSQTEIELVKKEMLLKVLTESEMRMKQIEDVLISKLIKQGIDARSLDMGNSHEASGKMVRKEIKIRSGLEKEAAKKLIKIIKDQGLKVQAAIMDDKIRVTGKKIDDLQAVIQYFRQNPFEVPLQYENMKS
jgi:uncharacterized protein YajQ (UPF0234 family)